MAGQGRSPCASWGFKKGAILTVRIAPFENRSIDLIQILHHVGHRAVAAMRDDARAELVYGGNGVRGRERHGGDLQHRNIVFVVADAVNVLARHAEERREPQDHAALGRAGGGQLEQMLVGVDELVLPLGAGV